MYTYVRDFSEFSFHAYNSSCGAVNAQCMTKIPLQHLEKIFLFIHVQQVVDLIKTVSKFREKNE